MAGGAGEPGLAGRGPRGKGYRVKQSQFPAPAGGTRPGGREPGGLSLDPRPSGLQPFRGLRYKQSQWAGEAGHWDGPMVQNKPNSRRRREGREPPPSTLASVASGLPRPVVQTNPIGRGRQRRAWDVLYKRSQLDAGRDTPVLRRRSQDRRLGVPTGQSSRMPFWWSQFFRSPISLKISLS